ncbi:hypothetical protein WR25_10142 isoform H [Diploscapter pachys]|uniref:Uncharacterized protein n=1 Tax=Diploscapter pachys TaxID=2018661 RepID=A0A2A2LEM1_9BILA|nr:hypothetical protein WR25_10142 isoform H [Diploscapter pachys]
MLLIVMINHSYSYEDNAIGLLYRICGLVVYCAMLFLNLTHSLEEITNISEDYSEDDLEANETLAMHEAAKHSHHAHSNGSLIEVPVDDHGHMLTDFEYRIYVYVAIADLAIRLGLASFSKLPTLKLHWAKAAILYTLTPLTIIGSYCLRRFVPSEMIPDFFNEQLEPLTSVILCLVYYAIIWKAFIALKPYLFAETPKIFSKQALEADIKEKFPYVMSCPHVHAFCIWPGKYFEVMISMNMKLNMSDDDWEIEAVNKYDDVRRYVHDKLEREGAQRVSSGESASRKSIFHFLGNNRALFHR